jgi:hypothetical protein
MKHAMARQAEAGREKRAKIINAEGKSLAAAALGGAPDAMMVRSGERGGGNRRRWRKRRRRSGTSRARELV